MNIRFRIPPLGALLWCIACADPTSAGYDRVGISVRDQAAASVGPSYCLTLPILIGSRVDAEYELDSGATLFVVALHDRVEMWSDGGSSRVPRTFFTDNLVPESFEVTSSSGVSYLIEVQSGCF